MLYRIFGVLAFCCGFTLYADEALRIELPIPPLEQTTVSEEDRKDAERLFQQALAAVREKRGTEAIRLAVRVLEKNPDHEIIRTLLGYKLHDGQWRTDWEIRKLEAGFVDHPEFGWISKEYVPRYEAGERFVSPARWISATQDVENRRDMRNGWLVESEHFKLLTNHSLEEGVRMSRRLEHFYRAWKLLFFNYLVSDEILLRLFEGQPGKIAAARCEVFVYRDKDDYVANLQGFESRIAESNGFYHARRRRSYFFPVCETMDEHEADTVRKTLYHEAAHQLFQETRATTKTPASRCNFWLVEGIAMFMETFRIEENRYVFGDIEDPRLYAAAYHRLEGNFYIPFQILVKRSSTEFLEHPRLTSLYSQSAGMTHFLMFAEDDRYRDAVILLLRDIYLGKDGLDSLSKLTGRRYSELDEEYTEFLKTIPE